jgi:hypothetical protein
MKRKIFALFLSLVFLLIPLVAAAQQEEPTIYVIKKGDTLWGLSDRFIKDPYYWPNLWAKNQVITNPHLIYPGQKVRIYPDRIELVEDGQPGFKTAATIPDQITPERTFTATGSEGFLLDSEMNPSGEIIQTTQGRLMVGQDDIVYTDIGTAGGAKSGNAYSIYRQAKPVNHPITGDFMGYKYLDLGSLKLTEMEQNGSRALIIKSYLEIGSGCILLPYQDKRREVSLKSATKSLDGFIIDSRLSNLTIGAGDVVYLDLGSQKGVETGNMIYVVRDIKPDPDHVTRDDIKLPQEIIGALVVVETGAKTSTALVVKSVEEIHLGDQVKLIAN